MHFPSCRLASRVVVALLALLGHSIAQAQLPPNFHQETVLSGLSEPVYLETLPDGRMLLLEKAGRILIFDPAEQPAQASTYLQITDINSGQERGLTSVAIDPQFSTNGFIYVYYTHGSSHRNRISRFTHLGDTANLNSEVLIWQDNEDWSNCCHYGGGIAFGPDGKLYLTTGEEFNGSQAQDLTRAGGKIIRINKDGSIPADNPFVDGPGGNLDEIWALGLRNPYRAFWDLVGGRLYIGDVGGNQNATAREELNYGLVGRNYGWPLCEGDCVNPDYEDPVYHYGHSGTSGFGGAITAGFVYRGSSFPDPYYGAFFFADYVNSYVKYLTFDGSGAVESVHDFASDVGAPVHLEEGRDGSLYAVDYFFGRVLRFRYDAGNQPPEISDVTISPKTGAPPLNVTFSATVVDAEDDSLTYRWVLGDGSDDFGQTVEHQYGQRGVYSAFLEVSDGHQSSFSETVKIEVGSPPSVSLDQPSEGMLFRAGDIISFSGSASDPDEVISDSGYVWDIDFRHNSHLHPTVTGFVGTSGQLQIEESGHDWHGNTGYQLVLTVTDSDGISRSDSVSIFPDKVNLTFTTEPSGIPISVDTLPHDTPFTYDTLIGFKHVVAAPASYCIDQQELTFAGWSDAGAASHEITVPTTAQTFTATYVPSGSCDLVAPGLVVRLESDAGVTLGNGGVVTGWADQSGLGNSLSALGDPTLLTGALNGHSVIDFDGGGDKLERVSGLVGLPSGNADRTVYLVANYRGTGYGGFAWGNQGTNRTFGLVVNPDGRLMVQGWGPSNDFDSGVAGTDQGWLVQSVVHSAGQMSHYLNGILIDTRAHSYATTMDRLVLGAEIDSNPYVDMQVAAVLVYARALSAAEQQQVESYLQEKYLGGGAGDDAPIANGDSAAVATGGSVVVDVLANDTDADGTLDPATVVVTGTAVNGTAVVNANGTISYTHNGSATVSDSFSYRVSDDGGLLSNEAAVTVIIEGGGGVAPAANDDSATVVLSGSVVVDVLANDTDPDGTLDPATVVLTGTAVNGTAVVNADGTISYTHNGSATVSDSFSYRVSDDGGLLSNEAAVTITIEGGGGVAPPAANDDSATVMLSGSVVVDVLANDTDPDGTLDPATVVLTVVPANGAASVNADGTITYTHGGSSAPGDTFSYRVSDDDGLESNAADVTIMISGDGEVLPSAGLVSHFVADFEVSTGAGGAVTGWADQVGGNDLTAGGDPMLLAGALNGHSVIDFDGGGDKLERVSGLVGLPSGNADRTVYLVANYRGTGYGGFAWGRQGTNRTFGLVVNPAGRLMVQGWGSSNDFDSGVAGTDQGWLVQSVVHSAGQMSHYLNGNLIDTRVHSYATTMDRLVLGAEIDSNPYVDMQVAAVLVYARALSAAEQQQVENYLQEKYLGGGAGNDAPIANGDSATVLIGSAVTIDVLANDVDGDGSLDPATVLVTAEPTNGTAVVNPDGTIAYTHDGSATTGDTFSYRVSDNGGLASNQATVTLLVSGGSSLPAAGMTIRLEADVGVTTGDGNVVTAWTDQAGLGNSLSAQGDPILLIGALNGHSVIDFDGGGDKLERVSGLVGLPSGNADRTVYLVVNYRGTGYGGFAWGRQGTNRTFGLVVNPAGRLMVQGWGSSNDFDSGVAGTGQGWLVQSVVHSAGQMSHYLNGNLIDTRAHSYATTMDRLVLGAEIDSNPYVDMQVAAVLVYARALSAAEQQQVENYLQVRYFGTGGDP